MSHHLKPEVQARTIVEIATGEAVNAMPSTWSRELTDTVRFVERRLIPRLPAGWTYEQAANALRAENHTG